MRQPVYLLSFYAHEDLIMLLPAPLSPHNPGCWAPLLSLRSLQFGLQSDQIHQSALPRPALGSRLLHALFSVFSSCKNFTDLAMFFAPSPR